MEAQIMYSEGKGARCYISVDSSPKKRIPLEMRDFLISRHDVTYSPSGTTLHNFDSELLEVKIPKRNEELEEDLELTSIALECPYLKRTVRINKGLLEWDSFDSPCDLCGSHGFVHVSFICDCGLWHNIKLTDW